MLKRWFWRLLYVVSVLSFSLPFVAVRGCEHNARLVTYSGWDLFVHDKLVLWYFIPFGIAVFFLICSLITPADSNILSGFLKSAKTALSGIAGAVIFFLPRFQFLFNKEYIVKKGQVLSAGCWVLVYAVSYIAMARLFFAARKTKPPPISKATLLPALFVCGFGFLLALSVPISIWLPLNQAVFSLKKLGVTFSLFLAFSLPIILAAYFLGRGLRAQAPWARRAVTMLAFIVAACALLLLYMRN